MDNPSVQTTTRGAPSQAGTRWLRVAVLVVFVALLVVGVMLFRTLMFEEREPRTMAELKIYRAEQMVKKVPDDPRSRWALGSAYLEVGRDEEAAEEFKTAVKLAPDSWELHFALGNAYVVLAKQRAAVKEFKTAIKLAPTVGDNYYSLGKVYLDAKQYEEAVKVLQEGLKVGAGAADTRFLLAQAYEATGKSELAIKEYRETLRYLPDYQEARTALERLENKGQGQK